MGTPKLFNKIKDIATNIEATSIMASSALPKAGGEISGNLNVAGSLSGNLTGNASTATKLAKAGAIVLSGDATGSVFFDGSDTTLTVTVIDDSHNHIIANVDNLETTLNAKANNSDVVKLTGNQTIGGTKTFSATISGSISGNAATATKATQDASGNVITSTYATKTELNAKAPLASPALTGTPTAPTATAGTNTTQIATTAFVKTAIDNIQGYTLPTATSSTLGGVKVGSNITNTSGTISLTKDNVTAALGYTPPTTDTKYTLPAATSSVLGGVKIGSNISLSSGTISLSSSNVTTALGYTPITSNGSCGIVSNYETTGTATTINASSANSNEVGSNITISNGTAGTSWTKIVRLTNVVSVTLGSSWSWQNGEPPTIVAGGILVCCWCGSAGIVTFMSPSA